MKLSSLRKPLIVTIFTLALLSYGFIVVNAAYPLTQWEPGETLDPTCSPGDANCSVANAWQMDLTNGYVFNDTDFVGIGTNTPTVELDILGQINVTDTVILSDAGPALAGHQNFSTIMSSAGTGDVQGQTFANMIVGSQWTGEDDVNGGSQLLNLLSSLDMAHDVGSVDKAIAGIFIAQTNGAGDVGELVGFVSNASHDGTGQVLEIKGFEGNAFNNTAQPTENVTGGSFSATTYGDADAGYGVNGTFFARDNATVTFARAQQLTLLADDTSTVTDAGGLLLRIGTLGGGSTIAKAIGIDMSAGLWNEVVPGIEANAGDAYGIYIEEYIDPVFPFPRTPGISASEDAYGFYLGEGAIEGITSEYGFYVADLEAENFLVNGVRIGVDSDNYKLQGAQNGLDAELYFGTNLVASYTPSDERLKTDIDPTQISLADLSQINIVDFTYDQEIINDNNKRHHGVIAQELERIYPNAVKERIDGYKVVDYTALVPLLIKSIQELQEQINNQTLSLIDNVREIFVGKVTTEEFCMGDRCINEDQFNELVDLLESGPSQDVLGDEEEVIEIPEVQEQEEVIPVPPEEEIVDDQVVTEEEIVPEATPEQVIENDTSEVAS